jgi:hydroxypyruvate isomerase
MATNRRKAIQMMASGTLGGGLLSTLPNSAFAADKPERSNELNGNINHAVCRWTYSFLSLDELCTVAKEIGIKAIDLIGPKEWDILKKHGLDSSMCNGAEISLTEGWNDPQYHAKLIQNYTEYIELVSKAGYKNLICFSGNRKGMDDEKGMKNCEEGLKKVMSLAEKKGVILQMELFNSKINHPDYMADKSAWGIELCKRLGSENFKLLYDIYHMQISEGDIMRTITDHHQYFGHYHTAGVPGRHEIDDNQELNYRAIMSAIVETGYKGYVAQEFIPVAQDKIGSLRMAVNICDV